MQAGAFMLVLFTTSYAPLDLLTGWFQEVARYNPVRFIVEGVRQMSVYGVDWTHTWKALLALALLAVFFGTLAMRGLLRAADIASPPRRRRSRRQRPRPPGSAAGRIPRRGSCCRGSPPITTLTSRTGATWLAGARASARSTSV